MEDPHDMADKRRMSEDRFRASEAWSTREIRQHAASGRGQGGKRDEIPDLHTVVQDYIDMPPEEPEIPVAIPIGPFQKTGVHQVPEPCCVSVTQPPLTATMEHDSLRELRRLPDARKPDALVLSTFIG
jgi:hypothetical protein